jgi:hypothetical protein
MALGGKDVRILARLCREGYIPHSGSTADLGAQVIAPELHKDAVEFSELAQARGIPAGPIPDFKDARGVWTWLGLQPTVFDIDGTPNAVPLDLNHDRAPLFMRGKFAVVTNYGTSEHVANQYNLFKVVHDLTRRWGIMIHHVPAQGFLNHGLLNYNPKFFWMLARSNRYKVLYHDFSIGAELPIPDNVVAEIEPYEPSIRARVQRARVTDCGVTMALQKMHAGPFVAPLDADEIVESPALERRYWTVQGASRLDRMRSAAVDLPTDLKLRLVSLAIKNDMTRPWFYRLRRLLGRGAGGSE